MYALHMHTHATHGDIGLNHIGLQRTKLALNELLYICQYSKNKNDPNTRHNIASIDGSKSLPHLVTNYCRILPHVMKHPDLANCGYTGNGTSKTDQVGKSIFSDFPEQKPLKQSASDESSQLSIWIVGGYLSPQVRRKETDGFSFVFIIKRLLAKHCSVS